MAGLAGLGVGGIVGALVGLGIPEYEARRYEGHLKQGGVLLSVHCETSSELTKAEDLLKHTGALEIIFALDKDEGDKGDEANADGSYTVHADNPPAHHATRI